MAKSNAEKKTSDLNGPIMWDGFGGKKVIQAGTNIVKDVARKYTCPSCGCVFEALESTELVSLSNTTHSTLCPQCISTCETYDIGHEVLVDKSTKPLLG